MRPMPCLLGLLLFVLPSPPAAAGADVSPGTLVVCDDVQDPLTLDPQKEFTEKNHTLVQQMYEGLARFDSAGRIEPALATSWARLDPLRMRFHLRHGVRFHNGEPFDAEAVRFTIARYLDPKTKAPAGSFLGTIDRVEVVDAYTADIVTKVPDGLLLNRLAGFVLIVPPRYVRDGPENVLEERPVGTGPFRFVSWAKGREIVLSANRDYWMRGYPEIDGLIFKFLPSAVQLDMLKSGGIDLTTELPGTLTTEAAEMSSIRVLKKPSFYAVTASFNSNNGPLNSLLVRRALNFGVNKRELVRYDQLGNGREIATVTMPGEEGHNNLLKPYPYEPRTARKLLKDAGYPKGFVLKTLVKDQGVRAAQIIAKQLEQIGVKLELHLVTDAEIMNAMGREHWDMLVAGCPDPMATSYFIQSIFLFSRSPYCLAQNPAYDERLNEMAGTLDDMKRDQIGRELDRFMHDQAMMLFLYQRIKTYGVRKGVSFTPSITGMPYFFNAQKKEPPHE